MKGDRSATTSSIVLTRADTQTHTPLHVPVHQLMHARKGGNLEVMGLLQGKLVDDTMIIMDVYALPGKMCTLPAYL